MTGGMTMTDDLVERLQIGWHDDDTPLWVSNAMYEAADRIEALTAQLESTLKDRGKIIANLNMARWARDVAVDAANATVRKLADAEADNARLKAALTGIKRAAAHRMQNDRRDLHSYYFHTADAALNTGKEPSHE